VTDYFNALAKTLQKLDYKYDRSRVFNDFLIMSICCFHTTNIQTQLQQKDEENEAVYFQAINPYRKEDLNILGEALGILQLNVLKHPYSDILGEFFMQHITKGQNGQYFTPEHVCDLMVKLNALEDQEGSRILDPACRSGRMQLSAAKINHRNYFFGADNSHTCAQMATLNFFLNGLKGEIAWMNSLSMEWYGGWHINMNGLGIAPIDKEQSQIWSEAPIKEQKPVAEQLQLF